uniref:Uncharacterized protein n=1 Tax=Arundo donax TaxID=35708 RepID=A0A0A9HBL5_ARUDO
MALIGPSVLSQHLLLHHRIGTSAPSLLLVFLHTWSLIAKYCQPFTILPSRAKSCLVSQYSTLSI